MIDQDKKDAGQEQTPYTGPLLEWTCHPMKRKPWVTLGVTFLITVVALGIYYWTDSKWFAVFGALVIFGSLAKFYFPTSYRLTDESFLIKTSTQTLTKLWANFRSCYPDKNGVLMSPFAEPSRLENFRGVYIMFNNNRDEVMAFVKERLAAAAKAQSKPATVENGQSAEGQA